MAAASASKCHRPEFTGYSRMWVRLARTANLTWFQGIVGVVAGWAHAADDQLEGSLTVCTAVRAVVVVQNGHAWRGLGATALDMWPDVQRIERSWARGVYVDIREGGEGLVPVCNMDISVGHLAAAGGREDSTVHSPDDAKPAVPCGELYHAKTVEGSISNTSSTRNTIIYMQRKNGRNKTREGGDSLPPLSGKLLP